MSYPNAFCVKCGTHTDTKSKHTVVLQNSARALRGVCPTCDSNVYKILPKGQDYGRQSKMSDSDRKRYPDAFCVKCQEHTETVNPHTVMLDNKSRAVTGSCKSCGSEVYRIIGSKPEMMPARPEAPVVPTRVIEAGASFCRSVPKAAFRTDRSERTGERRVPVTRPAEAKSETVHLTYFLAAGVIASIVVGFWAIVLF